jgi:hypothetical protein
MTFTVHCNWWYTAVGPGYTGGLRPLIGHGMPPGDTVWVRVVGLVPLKKMKRYFITSLYRAFTARYPHSGKLVCNICNK